MCGPDASGKRCTPRLNTLIEGSITPRLNKTVQLRCNDTGHHSSINYFVFLKTSTGFITRGFERTEQLVLMEIILLEGFLWVILHEMHLNIGKSYFGVSANCTTLSRSFLCVSSTTRCLNNSKCKDKK